MKIGILGGSFDPPHIAHALICRTVKEKLNLDEVWIMPCYGHTFNKQLSPVKDRLNMSLCLQEQHIRVSTYEIETASKGYTIKTLRALQKMYPKNEYYWIMGSDQLEKFHTWGPGWKNIFTDFHLVVYPRETLIGDLKIKTKRCLQVLKIPKTVVILNDPSVFLSNISSTMIRRRFRKNLPITHLVPPTIATYIKRKNLYKAVK